MPRRQPSDADDELLVDRFLAGDSAAFEALVLCYQEPIHRFVAWWLGGGDADDATQDVFVEVYRSLAAWRRRSSFRTWLYAVARNVCRRHARQLGGRDRAVAASEAEAGGAPDGAPGPFSRLVETDTNARLVGAIAGLPHEQRVTLMLRAWEGLSYAAIAAATGVPTGTVRSRLHSARRTLARAIAEDE